jgi:hypothetical protein
MQQDIDEIIPNSFILLTHELRVLILQQKSKSQLKKPQLVSELDEEIKKTKRATTISLDSKVASHYP